MKKVVDWCDKPTDAVRIEKGDVFTMNDRPDEWVAIEAGPHGGGFGHGPGDEYPHGWRVTAVPKCGGGQVRFYQTQYEPKHSCTKTGKRVKLTTHVTWQDE